MIYGILMLITIVLSNLMIVVFGPSISIINAFIFIGFDITARDKLHEAWHGKAVAVKMLGIMVLGGILTYILNSNAKVIAIASVVAFVASMLIDTIAYEVLFKKSKYVKINTSNALSSAADSFIFSSLAFGQILPLIILGQFLAKVIGGFVWSRMLKK